MKDGRKVVLLPDVNGGSPDAVATDRTNEAGNPTADQPEQDILSEQGVPTVDLTCALCEFVTPVMATFESLFYLEHLEIDGKLAHFVRAVGRSPK